MLTSSEKLFEEELYFACNVIQKFSSDIYIFLTLAANRNLIKKGYILKVNDQVVAFNFRFKALRLNLS